MLTLSSIERKVIENLKCVRCTGATYKHIAFVKHILYIICIKFRRKKSFVFTRELYLSIANDQCVSVKLQCITFHYCLALIFVLCAFFFGCFCCWISVAAGGCIGFSILYFQHTYPNTTCEVYYFVFFVAKNPIAAHHTIRL